MPKHVCLFVGVTEMDKRLYYAYRQIPEDRWEQVEYETFPDDDVGVVQEADLLVQAWHSVQHREQG